jgi:FtsZ-binding cell division protein ZapB
MVTLEQVKLLETKVAKALDFVNRVTSENTFLTNENALLKEKLDTYQKRIDELEVLIQCFKEDQSRIEEGILSALNRLNQFEDAVEKSLSMAQSGAVPSPEEAKSDASPGGILTKPEDGDPLEPPVNELFFSAVEPAQEAPVSSPNPERQNLFEPETEVQEASGEGKISDSETPANTVELDIF